MSFFHSAYAMMRAFHAGFDANMLIIIIITIIILQVIIIFAHYAYDFVGHRPVHSIYYAHVSTCKTFLQYREGSLPKGGWIIDTALQLP